jgi:hypothetical protein
MLSTIYSEYENELKKYQEDLKSYKEEYLPSIGMIYEYFSQAGQPQLMVTLVFSLVDF